MPVKSEDATQFFNIDSSKESIEDTFIPLEKR